MRYGVILGEMTEGYDVDSTAIRIRALDAWIAKAGGKEPDFVPFWARGPELWYIDHVLLDELAFRGIKSPVHADSTGVTYIDILAGKYDDKLKLLGCRAAYQFLRWDQEPDGNWGLRWQTPSERLLYTEAWVYVTGILRREGDVQMVWCPTDPKRAFEMGLYPGDAYVDVMAFDRFNRTNEAKLPPQRWRRSVSECNSIAPDKRVWVYESGILAGLEGRAAYIASLDEVTGVEVANVFDMLVEVPPRPDDPRPIRDDWRWNGPMYRAWRGLP